ncbi:MAG: FtsX-like permease family protein, partial [Bdellovibrionota bacterium]
RKFNGKGAYALRAVQIPYNGKKIAIKAFDEPDPSFQYSNFVTLDRDAAEAGPELYHAGRPAVMVSETFARQFNKKTGDMMELSTPNGVLQLKIVAQMVDFASPDGVLYLDRNLYKKYYKDALVTTFGVHASEGATPEELRQAIDRHLGAQFNLMTVLTTEFRNQLDELIDQSFTYTRAIESAALLVALLGLLNTLLVSVMERTREIGMLRAVGMSRSQVLTLILQEAMFQGTLGALVAVILGSVLAYLWVSNTLTLILGWMIQFHFPWQGAFATFFAGVLVALAAGFIPARRAAHIDIREALEYE